MKISPVPFGTRTATMLCQSPSLTDALGVQVDVVLVVPVDGEVHLAAGHLEVVLAVEVAGVALLDDDAVGAVVLIQTETVKPPVPTMSADGGMAT